MGWSVWVSQENKLMVVVLVPFVIFFCGRSFRNMTASLRADAWVLAYDSKRILIRIRRPTYYYLPAAELQILSLDYDQVKWIRKSRIKTRYVGGSTRNATQYKTYLEVALDDFDLQALGNRIKEESGVRRETEWWFFTFSVRGFTSAVEVVEDDVIRIQYSCIRPRIRHTLKELGKYCQVLPDEHKNPPSDAHKKQAGWEDRIIDLVENGNRVSAIELAKRKYGYTYKEAVRFIEGLAGENDDEAGL